MAGSAVECPELFSVSGNECSYARILKNLEQQYADAEEPLRLCGLSLGAILALDFTIRHRKKVGALVCARCTDATVSLYAASDFCRQGDGKRGYLEAFSFYAQFGSHSAAQGDSLSCNNYVWGKGLGESKSCGKIASSLAAGQAADPFRRRT